MFMYIISDDTFKPQNSRGSFSFIFHRDVLSCFVEIDPNITDIVMKYFLAHALRWLLWKKHALSVHAKVAAYTAETVKSSKSLTEEECAITPSRPKKSFKAISFKTGVKKPHVYQ